MEAVVAAAVSTIPPLLVVIWRDLRNRTNGHGPLAQKLDCIEGRVVRIEERTARIEERVGRGLGS